MTAITLAFNYPMQVSAKRCAYFEGVAHIELSKPLPAKDKDLGWWLIPTHRPIRWSIGHIEMSGLRGLSPDVRDIERFIRGRFTSRIEQMLYAAELRNAGHPEYAAVFDRLAEHQITKENGPIKWLRSLIGAA